MGMGAGLVFAATSAAPFPMHVSTRAAAPPAVALVGRHSEEQARPRPLRPVPLPVLGVHVCGCLGHELLELCFVACLERQRVLCEVSSMYAVILPKKSEGFSTAVASSTSSSHILRATSCARGTARGSRSGRRR